MRTNSDSNALKLVVPTTIQSSSCHAPGPDVTSCASSRLESPTGDGALRNVQLCSFAAVPLRPKRLSCPPACTNRPLLLPLQLPEAQGREPVNVIVTWFVGFAWPIGQAAVPAWSTPRSSIFWTSSDTVLSGTMRVPP